MKMLEIHDIKILTYFFNHNDKIINFLFYRLIFLLNLLNNKFDKINIIIFFIHFILLDMVIIIFFVYEFYLLLRYFHMHVKYLLIVVQILYHVLFLHDFGYIYMNDINFIIFYYLSILYSLLGTFLGRKNNFIHVINIINLKNV